MPSTRPRRESPGHPVEALTKPRSQHPRARPAWTTAPNTAFAQSAGTPRPFKIHRCLTAGAASFKSLYLKRPPGAQRTKASPRGRSRYSPKTYEE